MKKQSPKPYKPRSPKIAAFKTDKDRIFYLYDQYWFQGKTLVQIAKTLKVSGARIKELMERYHIERRRPGQRLCKR